MKAAIHLALFVVTVYEYWFPKQQLSDIENNSEETKTDDENNVYSKIADDTDH